jgi:hypothetical protein
MLEHIAKGQWYEGPSTFRVKLAVPDKSSDDHVMIFSNVNLNRISPLVFL